MSDPRALARGFVFEGGGVLGGYVFIYLPKKRMSKISTTTRKRVMYLSVISPGRTGGLFTLKHPKEPQSEKYFRLCLGPKEFINGYCRYCLWLGDCSPKELRSLPECLKRVEAVKQFRLNSSSAGTRKIAEKPTRFHVENMPKTNYIVVPEVSSERRRYIPFGFLFPDILCSNFVKLIPNATLYHFGVLTSSVHIAWMHTVAGRLKSDYRYSKKDIVYNNFP